MYHFSCAFAVTIFLVGLSSGLASSEPPMDFANIPWPKECENKTYCHRRPDNYPQRIFDDLLNGVVMKIAIPDATQNRTSVTNDIGNCKTTLNDSYIYLIKDDNERVRVVAETECFKQQFLIAECDKPGRITHNHYLDVTHNLHCKETKVPILLNVLSLDGTGLDSASPKGGIPFSCSTKKMKNTYKYNYKP